MAKLFCELGSEEAVKVVIVELQLELHPLKRKRMAKALGEKAYEQAVPKLLKLLKDYNATILQPAEALGEMGAEEAVPELLKALHPNLLQKQHPRLPRSAAEALGKIEGDKAAYGLPYLLTLIATESGQDAIEAIIGIQNQCQFYNYEIFQSPPMPKSATSSGNASVAHYEFHNAEVVTIIEQNNGGTVIGKQISKAE